jgi:serine/threonine-protein kinase
MAIRLKHDYPEAHVNLGNALREQARHKEAEAACREAIRLRPDYLDAHHSLYKALSSQGRYQEAEAVCREAIRLKPDSFGAHYNLGNALSFQGRHKEAEAAYREAIHLKPDYPEAHCNLGHALRDQGRFADALESLRRGHALGKKTSGWSYPSAAWVQHCERLVELDRQLPAVLRGKKKPASATEYLEFASLCQMYKHRHAAAARLYADAFAADPKLADDLDQQHRYIAACAAALAAAGKGVDASKLDDKERTRLRQQALDWLRADLAAYTRLVEKGNPNARRAIQQRLAHWQQDTDFTTLRDAKALVALPATERAAWQQLWADVAALLVKARKDQP